MAIAFLFVFKKTLTREKEGKNNEQVSMVRRS